MIILPQMWGVNHNLNQQFPQNWSLRNGDWICLNLAAISDHKITKSTEEPRNWLCAHMRKINMTNRNIFRFEIIEQLSLVRLRDCKDGNQHLDVSQITAASL